ncbi:hypothetical protein AX769_01465 [Frondihabitans sp. PAMC 28766]|uniref:TetR/AcrR family transcriptional regulator n=1 Tax=Frondihabitans sp. PAMC 28766 TaxID=1795630 RepID=UPI00078D20ED|nr:TetR/AcrR family transcriptional regulator [Frondihabitans sp. PAMC 28766]AMM19048.1 hypothetical protein AX769_01465 [Frondihabitans sp. PAMC 28766]
MPTPEKTSVEAIVLAARDLLELDGLAGLTMNAVAQRVGVRPPSLYKRVGGRDDLIRLVAEATLTDLARRLDATADPVELAAAVRTFGGERPAAFQLVMTPGAGVPVARPEYGEAASRAILDLAARLAGPDHALEAARTLTAWVVGFVSMELSGGFTLGGSVDDAWLFGVTNLLDVLSTTDREE